MKMVIGVLLLALFACGRNPVAPTPVPPMMRPLIEMGGIEPYPPQQTSALHLVIETDWRWTSPVVETRLFVLWQQPFYAIVYTPARERVAAQWSSSNPAIVAVTPEGIITTSITPGAATLTASYQGATTSITVTTDWCYVYPPNATCEHKR